MTHFLDLPKETGRILVPVSQILYLYAGRKDPATTTVLALVASDKVVVQLSVAELLHNIAAFSEPFLAVHVRDGEAWFINIRYIVSIDPPLFTDETGARIRLRNYCETSVRTRERMEELAEQLRSHPGVHVERVQATGRLSPET